MRLRWTFVLLTALQVCSRGLAQPQEPLPQPKAVVQTGADGKQTIDGNPVYTVGGDVHAPMVVSQVDPEFSEKARKKKKFAGQVSVSLIVDEHGFPQNVQVVRGIGYGLDEKAVEALQQYRFKPGTRGDVPVAVQIFINILFQSF